jgi:hypothetical protein
MEETMGDSWTATLRLLAVMAAIAASYIAGRWVAEILQGLGMSGVLPSLQAAGTAAMSAVVMILKLV